MSRKINFYFFLQFLIHCSNIFRWQIRINFWLLFYLLLFLLIWSNCWKMKYIQERCHTKDLKHDPPTTKTHTKESEWFFCLRHKNVIVLPKICLLCKAILPKSYFFVNEWMKKKDLEGASTVRMDALYINPPPQVKTKT